MYRGGLRFGLEHEEYYRCAQSFLQIRDTSLYTRMLENIDQSDIFLLINRIVSQAMENGELADGVTPELLLQLISSINLTIIEYLLSRKSVKQMNIDDLGELCDLGVQIILHGVSKRKEQ